MRSGKVAIIMGSESDRKIADDVEHVLKEHDIAYDAKVISAHRNPAALDEYIKKSDADVFIAIAGLSAALPGAIRSRGDGWHR